MVTRKDFIRKSLLIAAAGSIMEKTFSKNKSLQEYSNESSSENSPMVIATWNNLKATDAAMQSMKNGGSSLDAVEAGARIPEADPDDMSVGYGGFPDRDGNVTLDASIMDHLGNAGSVSFLQYIMHAVSVARKVMEKTPYVMLSGVGALQFAMEQGFKKENLLTEKAKQEWHDWTKKNKYTPAVNNLNHDTIGILAIDSKNNISGACSTSGWAFKMRGRVGDSPIIGAGLYVDNEVGGACSTGDGEYVMKTLGSFLIVELMRNGRTPQEAAEEAIHRITKKYNTKDVQVGYLALNKNGEHGAYSIKDNFTYSLNNKEGNKIFDSKFFEK